MKPIYKSLVIASLLVTLTTAFGQGSFNILTINNPSIETIGGVTYFKFDYETTCPDELRRSPSSVVGTNVNVSLRLVQNYASACMFVFPPPITQHQTALVLGSFPPGDYACQITTYFQESPSSSGSFPFTVLAPASMLSITPASGGQVVLVVKGTSNVIYQVQSSLNLSNWTTIRTKVGGPFIVTNTPAANVFYRVKVDDTTPVSQ